MLRVLLAVAGISAVSFLMPPGAAARSECSTPETSVSLTPDANVARGSSLVELFNAGQSFPDFLAAARARREGWLRITEGVQIADSSLARARAIGGSWRLLVVAIDACGDSMQQVPYIAKLAELVEGVSLRIVPPAEGKAVQASHRSLDGRTATPTFVLLDAAGADVGCIVELPREIREWTHVRRDSLSSDALHEHRREWYAEDRGSSIVHEVIEMLEHAKAGTPVCERGGSN